MSIIEILLSREMIKHGLKPGESKGLKKSDVLANLDPDTNQLLAAIPKKTMDAVWRTLGVEDG